MITLFIASELAIYLIFLVLDFLSIDSVAIKFIGITICLIFTVWRYLISKNKQNHYSAIARLFTMIGDIFLLVLNSYYVIGILMFCIVQSIYAYKTKALLGLRLALWFISIIALNITKQLSITNVLAMYSFVNLMVNFLSCSHNALFKVGLLLFLLCDLSVGLYNINIWTNITAYAMWLFYLPSQVLICLGDYQYAKE